MPSVISGDANVSATEFGFLDGVTSSLQTQINSKLNLAGGKILQIVRATDSTNRTTTSTSFVDASGMSVSITPQKSDSAIIVISIFRCGIGSADDGVLAQLTDSSNNALSGAESMLFLVDAGQITHSTHTLIGYSTPSSVSQQTYKVRFCATPTAVTATIANATNTGQLYAIEVSA